MCGGIMSIWVTDLMLCPDSPTPFGFPTEPHPAPTSELGRFGVPPTQVVQRAASSISRAQVIFFLHNKCWGIQRGYLREV